jgi:hypothetical protein
MQNLQQQMWDGQIEQNHFCDKTMIGHGGQLKFKIYILFHGDNSRTTALRPNVRRTKIPKMKDHGVASKFV